ncbi:hypothetical protein L843_0156 [Mycobacterium intracellulare MIN_061107_1834]|nr:hypothetical protein L843_0156 [Mycobacterium intracellulare MIN_061107_1834]
MYATRLAAQTTESRNHTTTSCTTALDSIGTSGFKVIAD